MTRLFLGLGLAAGACFLTLAAPAADPPETPGAKATREKKLKAKMTVDIDKKMLRELIKNQGDIPAAVKEATGLTLRILPNPGDGVTLTSSFGPFKGEMTLEELLNKICEEKSWGWYVNSTKVGDQNDGAIILTTNSKQRGYKEGAGPDAKKDDPKTKSKTKPKDKSKE